jgi:predicted NBD/HSP70 family sugar kinase
MGSTRTRAGDLLRLVHDQPGITRARAARMLGVGTGAATELVGTLVAGHLLGERPAPPTGGRGRPTTLLGPHPDGPVVIALSMTYREWRIQAVELGGGVVLSEHADHRGQGPGQVIEAMAASVGRMRRRLGVRIRGVGVSAPGIVQDGHLVEATTLGWSDVDLTRFARPGEVFAAGNDATFAASAESRRGRAVGSSVALHLRVDAGLGGAVVERGRISHGATGVAGEFGHMPFGDPEVRCPCGALGCWGDSVDGRALARSLGVPEPGDSVAFFRAVVDSARTGEQRAVVAMGLASARFGRGIAGLVNGLDPDLVTIGGLGPLLLEVAPDELRRAYLAGLMNFRRHAPPPILPTALGEDGPLIGAAEEAWAELWERLMSG